MVDRYADDIKRSKGILDELESISKERAEAKAIGKSVARFDYKLKMKMESIKNEQTALEKLIYLYKESDDVYNAISSGEK
jgi:hypothetical protein